MFYGADLDVTNASGNTALHICAVNNNEQCARILLFRGANKNVSNYNNQTPQQVAIIAGNIALAEMIKNFDETDVGESSLNIYLSCWRFINVFIYLHVYLNLFF